MNMRKERIFRSNLSYYIQSRRFLKGFFYFLLCLYFFMMATQFSHNSFLYFKYIIRKGNGTFVSSAYLKLQSFFILIPGSPKLPGPPKTFSFILYTYHSQNQRAKRTAKPFRPLILFFILFFISFCFLYSCLLSSFSCRIKHPKAPPTSQKANTRLTFSVHPP